MLQLKSSVRSPTSMSCWKEQEAAYFLISCTLALVLGSASVIKEQIWYLNWKIERMLLSLGLINSGPSFFLEVKLRYSFRASTGQILLVCPSCSLRALISLGSKRLLRPFLAKNEECGLRSSEFLSVNLQNSSSLTHACTLLILHPVASRRKAVFFTVQGG